MLYTSAAAGHAFSGAEPFCAQLAVWTVDDPLPLGEPSLVLLQQSRESAERRICPWSIDAVMGFDEVSDDLHVTWPTSRDVGDQWDRLSATTDRALTDVELLVAWINELDTTGQGPIQMRYESIVDESTSIEEASWDELPASQRPLQEDLAPQEALDRTVVIQGYIAIASEAERPGWIVGVRSSLGVSHLADLQAQSHAARIRALPGEVIEIFLMSEDPNAPVGTASEQVVSGSFTSTDSTTERDLSVSPVIYIGPIGAAHLSTQLGQVVDVRWISRAEFDALLQAGADEGDPPG